MIVREYKKEDLDSVVKVHIDTWNSAYREIVPEECLLNRTYKKQKEKWSSRLFNNTDTREFMFVAENDKGEIVGFASAIVNDTEEKFDSTLYTLYIIEEYQTKGFGKVLIKSIASKLNDLGAKSMVLYAFELNKACKFYEHLGGVQGDKNIVNISDKDLVEVEYIWEDISSLLDL
ncbi:MAG: GNAT family N-acetyltransferase [Paraclostridium sp.]|uniref:GNAT family N-acetyltransferase n=1 Tax=Paraclostridium sp. TaxID=2023273 RepID=UPI003EE6D188